MAVYDIVITIKQTGNTVFIASCAWTPDSSSNSGYYVHISTISSSDISASDILSSLIPPLS